MRDLGTYRQSVDLAGARRASAEQTSQWPSHELVQHLFDVPVYAKGPCLAELVLAEPAGFDSNAPNSRRPGSLNVPDGVADGQRPRGSTAPDFMAARKTSGAGFDSLTSSAVVWASIASSASRVPRTAGRALGH